MKLKVYEKIILDLLLSVHKECDNPVDWVAMRDASPPKEPMKSDKQEKEALSNLESYKPSFLDKTLRRVESQKEKLVVAVEEAKKADEQEYQDALKSFEEAQIFWKECKEIAEKVIEGDVQAYVDVIEQF